MNRRPRSKDFNPNTHPKIAQHTLERVGKPMSSVLKAKGERWKKEKQKKNHQARDLMRGESF
jgi:hypothetical protein